jgi:FkbM family methyltransferase
MNIKLVTVTWNNLDNFDIEKTSLYQSFKKFNPTIPIEHFHFNRGHYHKKEQEFSVKYGVESEYLLYKIELLLEKLKTINSDYVIFSDASDVTCMRSVDYLLEMFDLNNYIIAGCEKNMWPPQDRKNTWENYIDYDEYHKTSRIFLNSGLILSRTDNFIKMLSVMLQNIFTTGIKSFSNDQGVYTYYYTMNFTPTIKLDISNIFALNTFSRSVDEFYKNEQHKLVSRNTGIIPCFVHDNGWNHGSPKYHNHFELKRLYSQSYPHLKNISKQNPIAQTHRDYLINLKERHEFVPKVIYDIGACVLHWTTLAKEVWPDAQYVLFDAMEESEELFQETNYPYYIGVLSDVDDKEVTFYKNTTFPGGNSYYMENPLHSSMATTLFENPGNQFKRKTITLDTVRKLKNLPYPDLLKIDVQGCEIDILRGATDILQHVNHLIVELQHVEYNIGANLCDTSIPIIESMGFELVTPKFSLSSHADADYHFRKKLI